MTKDEVAKNILIDKVCDTCMFASNDTCHSRTIKSLRKKHNTCEQWHEKLKIARAGDVTMNGRIYPASVFKTELLSE